MSSRSNHTTRSRHNGVIDKYYDILVKLKYTTVGKDIVDMSGNITLMEKCQMVSDEMGATYHPGSVYRIINAHNCYAPAEYNKRLKEAEERFFENNPNIKELIDQAEDLNIKSYPPC